MNVVHCISQARGHTPLFGSTYQYEKTFSKMKYVKSHYQSAQTDGRVQSLLMTGNTNFELQLNVIPPHNKRIPFTYETYETENCTQLLLLLHVQFCQ